MSLLRPTYTLAELPTRLIIDSVAIFGYLIEKRKPQTAPVSRQPEKGAVAPKKHNLLDSNARNERAHAVLDFMMKKKKAWLDANPERPLEDCPIIIGYNAIIEAETWPTATVPEAQQATLQAFSVMNPFDLGSAIAQRGGDLARYLRDTLRNQNPPSKRLNKKDRVTGEWKPDWKLGDGLIAATAEAHQLHILTYDKDFDVLRERLVTTTSVIQLSQVEIAG